MISTDIAVIGAGPGGISAAIVLAQGGKDVTVIDQAQFPREKYCGDGLTASAIKSLDKLGLDPSQVKSWTPINRAILSSPKSSIATLGLSKGLMATATRYDLDSALVNLAKTKGIKVFEGCKFKGVLDPKSSSKIILDVENLGQINCNYVIGADGMWSPTRKAFGVFEQQGYLGDWHAFRQYFSNVSQDPNELWVFFEPEILPGYAWSFPVGEGKANVGFGIKRKSGQRSGEMKKTWNTLLERSGIKQVLGKDAKACSVLRAWPIPTRITTTKLFAKDGKVLFVGDAARAGDAMTGEGIAQALTTGHLAAMSILESEKHRSLLAHEIYYNAVRRYLGTGHSLTMAMSKLLQSPTGADLAVRGAGKPYISKRFSHWLFEDYPKTLVDIPRLWKQPK